MTTLLDLFKDCEDKLHLMRWQYDYMRKPGADTAHVVVAGTTLCGITVNGQWNKAESNGCAECGKILSSC